MKVSGITINLGGRKWSLEKECLHCHHCDMGARGSFLQTSRAKVELQSGLAYLYGNPGIIIPYT